MDNNGPSNRAPVPTPQREAHDYLSEISERADVRPGNPCLWEPSSAAEANFAIFRRDAAMFDRSNSTIRKRGSRSGMFPGRNCPFNGESSWQPENGFFKCLNHRGNGNGKK